MLLHTVRNCLLKRLPCHSKGRPAGGQEKDNSHRVSSSSEYSISQHRGIASWAPEITPSPDACHASPVISAAGLAIPWTSVLPGTQVVVVTWGLLGCEASWGRATAGLGRGGGVETTGGLWSRSSGGGTGTATGGELHASLFTRSTSMGPLTLFK